MSRYLFRGSYTAKGLQGLLRDGGSERREQIETLFHSLGGNLEAVYFALGEDDVYAIANLPDNVSAAAASLAANSTGAFQCKTVVLMTPEEIDEATTRNINYRPPGE
jgi:uncharacterized protein with GYD domain